MSFLAFTAALDRRLRVDAAAPLAVGFSGGGDSLALLILTLDWARAHGRSVLSLTVDHQLNPASAVWTADAVAKARALGAEAHALTWTGPKPATGLSAAARTARHALLAEAARQAGARVLLLGHTADDLAEAAQMRAEGSTVSDPREWSPSPAWPEGRGVFVLRPLLAVRRGALRAWLRSRGETWLEDPANQDPRSARARARRDLQQLDAPHQDPGPTQSSALPAGGFVTSGPTGQGSTAGYLVLRRDAPAAEVAAACLCAAGTSRPPRGERLRRLVDRIRAGEAFTATLAGARIEAAGDVASFFREPGEARRFGSGPPPVGEVSAQPTEGGGTERPTSPPTDPSGRLPHGGRGCLQLPVGQAVVWDGRYEITAAVPGLAVQALQGLAALLPPDQRRALRALPAGARPGLPALLDPEGGVGCPILAGAETTHARCLVVDRFEAATGRVDQEPAT